MVYYYYNFWPRWPQLKGKSHIEGEARFYCQIPIWNTVQCVHGWIMHNNMHYKKCCKHLILFRLTVYGSPVIHSNTSCCLFLNVNKATFHHFQSSVIFLSCGTFALITASGLLASLRILGRWNSTPFQDDYTTSATGLN